MYDQIRYVKATNYLRNFDFSSAEFEFGRIGSTVRFASYIYFLIPLPFVVHISSIAFMNKFLYLCLYVYLNKNKYLDKYIDIFYLIFPSLILYTSVSLRDTIIFVLSVIILILYFKKKYFSTLIAILLLFLNRDVMAVITVIVLSMHYVFFENKINKFKFIFIYFFIGISIFLLVGDQIFNYINFFRIGLYFDNGIVPLDVPVISGKYEFILIIFKNLINCFFIPSLDEANNLMRTLQFYENVIIFIFILLIFIIYLKKNPLITIFWLFFLMVTVSFFSVMVENPGTFVRYKFSVIMFFVSAISLQFNLLKNEQKK